MNYEEITGIPLLTRMMIVNPGMQNLENILYFPFINNRNYLEFGQSLMEKSFSNGVTRSKFLQWVKLVLI